MAKRIEALRLIDADAFFNDFPEMRDYEYASQEYEVDAVSVLRCKDCYYCATEKTFGKEYLYCDAFYEHAEGDLIGASLMVEPNHFCSWGERREDGKKD